MTALATTDEDWTRPCVTSPRATLCVGLPIALDGYYRALELASTSLHVSGWLAWIPDRLRVLGHHGPYLVSSRSAARRFFMILRAATICASNAGSWGVSR